MRRLTVPGAALALALHLGGATTTHAAVTPRLQPAASGSQLIYYYDAREGFTTFANITQFAVAPITVQMDFWGPTFQTKITQTFTLGSNEQRVIDIGALKTTNGLGAQQGIAVASVINEFANAIDVPVLTGNFTVANLATGSAWGAPAAARSARNEADGSLPPIGAVIDGTNVVYQSIQSQFLVLSTFYNPETLSPVSARGNQVIFINFKNAAGAGAPVTSASTTWEAGGARGNGQAVDRTVTVSGVTEFDLVSLLGEGINGSSGSIFFRTDDVDVGESRLIYFAQALGTFGTGYLLPPSVTP